MKREIERAKERWSVVTVRDAASHLRSWMMVSASE